MADAADLGLLTYTENGTLSPQFFLKSEQAQIHIFRSTLRDVLQYLLGIRLAEYAPLAMTRNLEVEPGVKRLSTYLLEAGWDFWFHHNPYVDVSNNITPYVPDPYIDDVCEPPESVRPTPNRAHFTLLLMAAPVRIPEHSWDLCNRLRRCSGLFTEIADNRFFSSHAGE